MSWWLMGSLEDAADITFAQPMSTARQIAQLVVACAHDGRTERAKPMSSAILATAAYLLPAVRRLLEPVMKRRGHREKQHYMRERITR